MTCYPNTSKTKMFLIQRQGEKLRDVMNCANGMGESLLKGICGVALVVVHTKVMKVVVRRKKKESSIHCTYFTASHTWSHHKHPTSTLFAAWSLWSYSWNIFLTWISHGNTTEVNLSIEEVCIGCVCTISSIRLIQNHKKKLSVIVSSNEALRTQESTLC